MKNNQIFSLIVLLFGHSIASENLNSTEKQDLTLAEAKNGELEIIKSIKKINDDGSYTIGYEADDGSFKIESRDVLGNIKGTYGYLDDDGEVKRISYTTNNITERLVETPSSVVQRIPKTNKTNSTSNKPTILLYNPTTPLSSEFTQEVTKPSTSKIESETTDVEINKPNYKESSKSKEVTRSSTSRSSNIVYATSSPPNVIFSPRSLTRSHTVSKSEGQIIRPEVVTRRGTDLPAYRRSISRQVLVDEEGNVQKIRSPLLRRQLIADNPIAFDPRKHIENLQQSAGDDSADVYSASLSTATPRPLFTTTSRSRILSTVKPPASVENLTSRNLLHKIGSNGLTTTELVQDVSTENSVSASTTPAPVHEQNIKETQPQLIQPPFIQVKHPYNDRVLLVPINHVAQQNNEPQYYVSNGQYYKQVRTTTEAPRYEDQVQNLQPIYIRRPIPKTIPVSVEPARYAPQLQPRVAPIPFPLFTPASTPRPQLQPQLQTQLESKPRPLHLQQQIQPQFQPKPNYELRDAENDVSYIKPPVSTKDFQKIIEYLILRQSKLEQVNSLINAQREREFLNLRRHRSYPTPVPIFIRRSQQEVPSNGPITFVTDSQQRAYVATPEMQIESQTRYMDKNQNTYEEVYPVTQNSYTPTRRVARLLPENPPKDNYENENYLPAQIREMLLLRMLQLAINPALPLDTMENVQDSTPAEQQISKQGIRNVQVLGEELELHNLRTV